MKIGLKFTNCIYYLRCLDNEPIVHLNQNVPDKTYFVPIHLFILEIKHFCNTNYNLRVISKILPLHVPYCNESLNLSFSTCCF